MNNNTPDRSEAINALNLLAQRYPASAAPVGCYMEHLEALNDRLAQHAAAAGKVLEAGKRDLMRAGWVAAWMTIQNDPDRIHDDPSAAFNTAFDALNGETQ